MSFNAAESMVHVQPNSEAAVRALFGIGTPRGLQGAWRAFAELVWFVQAHWQRWKTRYDRTARLATRWNTTAEIQSPGNAIRFKPTITAISTGW